jgi:uncharacterized membrane protein YdjX (TVP38/TMEM64 family)
MPAITIRDNLCVAGTSESVGVEPEERASPVAIAASIAAAVVVTVLVLTIDPLRNAVSDAAHGDTESLRADLLDLDAAGVLIVLALAIVHAAVVYPTEILNTAAGFVYGFWLAMPLMMVAWMINGIICHQVGYYAARPLLLKLLRKDRFERYERAVARGGVTLLIALRLVPIIPFSLVSYVLGSARVPLRTFIWTTAVGYLPLTALFVILGSRLQDISAEDPVIWGGAIVLIILLLITRKTLPMLADEKAN